MLETVIRVVIDPDENLVFINSSSFFTKIPSDVMKPIHILSPFKAFRILHKSSEQAYREAPLDGRAFGVDGDEDTMDIRQAGEGFDRIASTKRYFHAGDFASPGEFKSPPSYFDLANSAGIQCMYIPFKTYTTDLFNSEDDHVHDGGDGDDRQRRQ